MKQHIFMLILLTSINLSADWTDIAGSLLGSGTKAQEKTSTTTTSIENDALKIALKQGVSFAVESLSKKDGYLNDTKAKIVLPQSISTIEPYIRKSGGDKMLDDLILSMNTAATQAAPKTADIFYESIKKMTISDAQKILKSEDNALTEYFKDKSYSQLEVMIKPIVKKMMDENSVSYFYKEVRGYYEKNSSSIPYKDSILSAGKSFGIDEYTPPKDLDLYVTQKAIEGLFVKIAQEEKKIRDNPLVQKSELIRSVFGSI